MARKKSPLTQDELNDLAERVQDLTRDVQEATERVSVMASLATATPTAQFNHMIEAASGMNRMLLAIAQLEEEKPAVERRLAKA